jgi:hypothetical protein
MNAGVNENGSLSKPKLTKSRSTEEEQQEDMRVLISVFCSHTSVELDSTVVQRAS